MNNLESILKNKRETLYKNCIYQQGLKHGREHCEK